MVMQNAMPVHCILHEIASENMNFLNRIFQWLVIA
jgi:hypothetical protein